MFDMHKLILTLERVFAYTEIGLKQVVFSRALMVCFCVIVWVWDICYAVIRETVTMVSQHEPDHPTS